MPGRRFLSLNSVCFLYIHGIQPLKQSVAGYSKPFHDRMLRALKRLGVPVHSIRRREVVWSDLTFRLKDQYLRRQFQGRHFRFHPVRRVVQWVQPSILDILFYVKNKGTARFPGEMKVLERLQTQVRTARKGGCSQLVLFAHSLGSVAAYDYAFRFQSRFLLPETMILKALVTFGSPIPFFASAMGHPFSDIGRPQNVEHWLNFWDQDDPIACRCAPHFPKGIVKDISVDTASMLRPDKAHLGYWSKGPVIEKMAKNLESAVFR